MRMPMNGPFSQLAALGIIALVALIPSPDILKSHLEDYEPSTVEVSLPNSGETVAASLQAPAYDAQVESVVEMPFPTDCLSREVTGKLTDLRFCATELATFIELRDPVVTRDRQPVSSSVDNPIPEVEEARRALAEICRAKWSNRMPMTREDRTNCAAYW